MTATIAMIVSTMRADPAKRWTAGELAKVTPLSATEVAQAIQSMRWKGMMKFDAVQLTASMLAEIDERPAPAVRAPDAKLVQGARPDSPSCPDGGSDNAGDPDACEPPSKPERREALSAREPAQERVATAPVSGADRLRAEVDAEARSRTKSRSAARAIANDYSDVVPQTVGEHVASALAEDVQDAMLALSRRWPDLWRRILADARKSGIRPGILLADAVEAGLDALAHGRRVA